MVSNCLSLAPPQIEGTVPNYFQTMLFIRLFVLTRYFLPIATKCPSIVLKLRGTEYQYCKYRCYQHSVYCGIVLSISNLLAYISLPPPLLLFLFTHFTDCINMASSQPEVEEESFRKGGKKTRRRGDHSAT